MFIIRTPYDAKEETFWKAQDRVLRWCWSAGLNATWLRGVHTPTHQWHFWRVPNERGALLLYIAMGDIIEIENQT